MSPAPRNEDAPVELVWEAPPERMNPTMYDDALQEVKKNAGRWARLRVFDTDSSAYSARANLIKLHGRDSNWEFRVSRPQNENGKTKRRALYARYRTAEQVKAAK